jgi:hypothetical protein
MNQLFQHFFTQSSQNGELKIQFFNYQAFSPGDRLETCLRELLTKEGGFCPLFYCNSVDHAGFMKVQGLHGLFGAPVAFFNFNNLVNMTPGRYNGGQVYINRMIV